MEQINDDSVRNTLPYSSICQLRMDFPNSPPEERNLHRGTGSLIGPRVLLTAAHNIFNPIYGQAETIEVVIGKNVETLRNKNIGGPFYFPREWKDHVGKRPKEFSPFDYGIVRLRDQYENRGRFRLKPILEDVKVVTVSGFLGGTVVGTPEVLLKGTGKLNFRVNNDPNRKLAYDIITEYGISGGPIFYKVTEPKVIYYQIGIHSGQPKRKPYAFGVKITWPLVDDLQANI